MSQALQSQPELITLEQYEALAEEQRAEVFDGIVHDMAGPSQIHQRMLLKLSAMLDSYVERKKGSCLVTRISWTETVATAPRISSLRLFPREIRQMIISGKHIITKNTMSGNTGLWIRSAGW